MSPISRFLIRSSRIDCCRRRILWFVMGTLGYKEIYLTCHGKC
jgi:hypothetical protein